MASYKQKCMEYMNRERLRFEDIRAHVVKISYKGENMKTIPLFLYFDEEGDAVVALKCWNIVNFREQKELAISLCNDLNEKYRWVKFYVDEDADVIAELDAYIGEQNCGAVCTYLVRRMAEIVDDVYPRLMKALWE